MMDNDSYSIEEILLNSIKKLLAGRVNERLEETEFPIPLIEFGRSLTGGYAVSPVLRLSSGERTEKNGLFMWMFIPWLLALPYRRGRQTKGLLVNGTVTHTPHRWPRRWGKTSP
jgi:hypothetical protein